MLKPCNSRPDCIGGLLLTSTASPSALLPACCTFIPAPPISARAPKGSVANSNLTMTSPCLILPSGSTSPAKNRQTCSVCLPDLPGQPFQPLPSCYGQCFSPGKASARTCSPPSTHVVTRRIIPIHPPRVGTKTPSHMNVFRGKTQSLLRNQYLLWRRQEGWPRPQRESSTQP